MESYYLDWANLLLRWFYWESYSTWLTGFSLFTVSYLWNASVYLIDRSLMNWSPGAAIGVALSFLVVFWIIPGQRKIIASMKAGTPVDPVHGQRGKQRSVHNTYFTLPVLFAMLSNHYSFLSAHKQNWLVLILMMFAGAAIRQFFVMRHGWKLGRNRHPAGYALVGLAVIVATVVWLAPDPTARAAAAAPPPEAGFTA